MENKDPRHNARKLALGVLFCEEFLSKSPASKELGTKIDTGDCFQIALDALELEYEENIDLKLTNTIVEGVKKNLEDIDDIIGDCAPEWPIDKIAKLDLIVLRIAIFEILYFNDTPEKVAIDEAVELCKDFGGESSGKFVNGVLGTVVEIKKAIK